MAAPNKSNVAALFRRFPWLASLGQRIWRLRQARYSVGAVGVVFDDDGRVLLLEHVFHPHYPWGLPGGWVDRHESPADAVVRELLEETGLSVRVVSPVWVDLGIYNDHLDLAYWCQLEGGELRLSSEILDYQWCEPSQLPELFVFQRKAVERALRLREAMQ